MKNPYNPAVTCNNYHVPHTLIGRVLHGFSINGEHFAVAGRTKSGKSSFLKALLEILPDQAVLFSPDLYDKPSASLFFQELTAFISPNQNHDPQHFSKEPYQAFQAVFLQHLPTDTNPWIVLIDDADDFFNYPETRRLPHHLNHLATINKKLRDHFRFIFTHHAGPDRTYDMPEACQDFTTQLFIEPLESEQTLKIARAHFSQDIFPDVVVIELHRITGGHPYFVIGALARLWTPDTPQNQLSMDDVHQALQTFRADNRLEDMP